MLSRITSLADA
jgi:hypothetical protein